MRRIALQCVAALALTFVLLLIVSTAARADSWEQTLQRYVSLQEFPSSLLDRYLADHPQLRHLRGAVVSTEFEVILPTTTSGRVRIRRYEVDATRLDGQPG